MTPKEIQQKNYYFMNTIREEIKLYQTISFDIFDTLILRNVLFATDIFRVMSERIKILYGITDFHIIRENIERDVRSHSSYEDITLDEIYEEISIRYPKWPIDELKQLEIKCELNFYQQNPFIKQLFDTAVSLNKEVFLISDMYLPQTIIESILKKCGYFGYKQIYLSGEVRKAKFTGSLFKKILDEGGVSASNWLHIGDNGHSDGYVPRQYGITAAVYHCPLERFLQERSRLHQLEEEKNGHPIQEMPLDDSLEFSMVTAKKINTEYTKCCQVDTEEVISVQNVSMMFNMSTEKVDNLKEYVVRFLKRNLMFQEFWALKNVSFSVRRGEKVGLVGLNGSGKSTMLKIVSGVMKPTMGAVSVKGTIAPLIELGAGFDFELSAKENIYLNGAILGYSREDMDKRYHEIIEFSELHQFQDVAIKNFSSGMIARLGFAIATSHVPDILIIDEILSVGDFAFQEKCKKKMKQLTSKGATVLFVSHSAGDIIAMCDRAIWLDHGHLVAEGEAQYIVEKYLNK